MRQYLAFLRLRFQRTNTNILAVFRKHFWQTAFALAAASVALPFVTYVGAEFSQEVGLTILYGLVGPVVILVGIYVFAFSRSASELYFEKEAEAAALDSQLNTIATRRFKFDLSSEPFSRVAYGGTHESPLTGSRQTQILGEETVLRLSCKNDSGLRIEACRASIIDARKIDENGDEVALPFYENIELLWSRDIKRKETTVDIEPWSARLLYVVASRPAGAILCRDLSGLPLEYHRLFLDQDHFRMWIQVNGSNDTGARVCIDVEKREGEKTGWTARIISQEVT